MDTKEFQRTEVESDGQDSPEVSGVGSFLRTERERQGLSFDQVAQTTKLRRQFISALEDENWDDLPQPVFVRGFIRSYAQALGLDDSEALDLYKRVLPLESAIPKSLTEPKRRPGSLFLILILVILGGIAFIVYQRFGDSPEQNTPNRTTPREPAQSEESGKKDMPPSSTTPAETTGSQDKDPKGLETAPASEPNISVSGPVRDTGTDEEKPEEPAAVIEYASEENRSPETVPGPAAEEDDSLVLQGHVTSRTWVRIYIDDQEPKEYIFQAGSKPQWKAKKGFNIVVGNASGIEFDFNGKRVTGLGRLGQVVRIKLPEEFNVLGFEE
ncbi:RodZ domain-containing protein [Thermodesulfobacteriota bacterium]